MESPMPPHLLAGYFPFLGKLIVRGFINRQNRHLVRIHFGPLFEEKTNGAPNSGQTRLFVACYFVLLSVIRVKGIRISDNPL